MAKKGDSYKFALDLGFSEEDAEALQAVKCGAGASRENILRIAVQKGLASTKPDLLASEPEPTPANIVEASPPAKKVKKSSSTSAKKK